MTTLSDDDVIARVRSALDEVEASEPAVAVVATPASRDRRETLRWIGIAAAGVVVLGAVAWAVTRPGTDEPAATLPPLPTTTTALDATATTLATDPGAPWFVLTSPDFVPGQETDEQWGGEELHQAWEWADGDEYGLVTAAVVPNPTSPTPEGDYLTEEVPDAPDGRLWILTPSRSDAPNADSTALDWGFEAFWARSTGEVWRFRSVGLSKDALVRAVGSATAGSGVPIVIADPSARLLGFAGPQGSGRSQSYTSTADGSEVIVRTGEAVLLGSLSGPTLELVTVAGRPGWQTSNPFDGSGRVVVMWEVGNGTFGQLLVPAALADRVPGLIAAIAEAPGTPAVPVPAPTTSEVPQATGPWFVLTTPDLVPGEETTASWDTAAESTQAWEIGDGDTLGIVSVMRITGPDAMLPQDATLEEIPVDTGRLWLATYDGAAASLGALGYWERDGELWLFRQGGLSNEAFVDTIVGATQGPDGQVVLADTDARLLGVAGPGGSGRSQPYTATDGIQVLIQSGDVSLLASLDGQEVQPVTVAGRQGWRASYALESSGPLVMVVWDAGDGTFVQLSIPPALADRADELIADVTESFAN